MSRLAVAPSEQWVLRHISVLADLLPDFVAMYSQHDLTTLIERILHRADFHGLEEQDATVAFCFASIKLGVGFEDSAEHASWFDSALRGTPADQAARIWGGAQEALGAGLGLA